MQSVIFLVLKAAQGWVAGYSELVWGMECALYLARGVWTGSGILSVRGGVWGAAF